MSESQVTVAGNIIADPVQRVGSASGRPFVTFRVAANHHRWDRERGEFVQSHTNYYEVVAFGALGQNVFESMQKGSPVLVSGRLRVQEWENGEKRGTSVQVTADHVGHDLRFGCSSFTKVNRPRIEETPAQNQEQQASAELPEGPRTEAEQVA